MLSVEELYVAAILTSQSRRHDSTIFVAFLVLRRFSMLQIHWLLTAITDGNYFYCLRVCEWLDLGEQENVMQ